MDSPVPSQGHVAVTRSGNDLRLYGNGAIAGTLSIAPTFIVNTDLILFQGASTARIFAAHAGRGLTASEMQALSTIISDYVAGL